MEKALGTASLEPVFYISVNSNGSLSADDMSFRCALGKNGVIEASAKAEGDGKTPLGCWQLRYVLYRPDRVARPQTDLPVCPLTPEDGWCDDVKSPSYNRPVRLPFAFSHENLWREDDLYNILVVLGHNDAPTIKGAGSAIFMHIARPDFEGTEGCIALKCDDLVEILSHASPLSFISITK